MNAVEAMGIAPYVQTPKFDSFQLTYFAIYTFPKIVLRRNSSMPIYEYNCLDCRKRNTYLILTSNAPALSCKHCRSANLERIMSRFAAPKSEEARLEALADPGKFGDMDENDPQSMARFMKKMGKEMGEDFGEDMDEAMDSMDTDDMGMGMTASEED
jgi:putative FmdB family regulatory protein